VGWHCYAGRAIRWALSCISRFVWTECVVIDRSHGELGRSSVRLIICQVFVLPSEKSLSIRPFHVVYTPAGLMCKHMTSSTKPEVHNVPQRWEGQITASGNDLANWKFKRVVPVRWQTDRQTRLTQYAVPAQGLVTNWNFVCDDIYDCLHAWLNDGPHTALR